MHPQFEDGEDRRWRSILERSLISENRCLGDVESYCMQDW